MERLLMVGRDYPQLGDFCQKNLDQVLGCISAGRDPDSPSFAYKGDKVCPNEDGLLILKNGDQWLLAVADGHMGHQTSHALLDGLAQLTKVPARLGPLSLALSAAEWIEDTAGGTTLLLACCDRSTGSVFGLSFGDSSLVTLGPSGAQVRNDVNNSYLRGGEPIDVEMGRPFQFQLTPGDIMLLFTDGVNECCYRDPFRSVKLQHLDQLYKDYQDNPGQLTQALMEMALRGVDGHPGGQDNIVIATFPFRQTG